MTPKASGCRMRFDTKPLIASILGFPRPCARGTRMVRVYRLVAQLQTKLEERLRKLLPAGAQGRLTTHIRRLLHHHSRMNPEPSVCPPSIGLKAGSEVGSPCCAPKACLDLAPQPR